MGARNLPSFKSDTAKNVAKTLMLSAMLLALSACGGGGGGASASDASAPAQQQSTASTPASFKVRGAVKGLLGSGLALHLNGAESINIAAEGGFEFLAPIQTGADYSVAIKTQPNAPTQTCTVNHGNGTMASQDVSNVAVTCSINSYKVSAEVSGLLGTGGLVLQNNAGDDLAVMGSGIFTFSMPVASGAAYAITVKTSPTGPVQQCSVFNGVGIIGGADVQSARIHCSISSFNLGVTTAGLKGNLLVSVNSSPPSPVSTGVNPAVGRLPDGSSYSVTVHTQPQGQICTVTNGTGVVSGADVTNISINCSDVTHRVGVQVYGYDGEGLVLQNNGGDDLAISANGTAWFQTPVVQGSPFGISIKDLPKTPDQACTLQLASGTVFQDMSITRVDCVTPAARLALYGDGPAPMIMRSPGIEVRGFAAPGMISGQVGTFLPTTNTVLGVVVDPAGENAYAVDDANVYRFNILSGSAGLGIGAVPPVATLPGNSAIVMDPLGHFVLVVNQAQWTVTTYGIDPSTKELIPRGMRLLDFVRGPASATIDPTGKFLVVKPTTGTDERVEVFALQADGTTSESSPSSVDHLPGDVVFNSSGNRLWISHRDHNSIMSGYVVTETTAGGGLAARLVVASPTSATGEPAYRMARSPSGKFMVTIEGLVGTPGTSKIVAYSINAAGRLTRVSELLLPVAGEVKAISFEPSGKYVHVVQPLYTTIYSIDRTGALAQHQHNYIYPLGDLTSVAIVK